MRSAHLIGPALVLSAAVALGCSGPRGGGALAGTTGTSITRLPPEVGRCMFDRGAGIRRCLHFAFGSCQVFGDPCSEDELRAQREAEAHRVAD